MPIYHQTGNSIGNHSYNVFIYDKINYELHFHKNYEIIYVIEGSAICCINRKTRTIRKGDFAFCLSNEVHSIKSEGKAKIWIGVFSEDFIHEFKKYQKNREGEDFVFRCPESLMNYLTENLIKSELCDVFVIKSCLYALCSEYLKQIPLVEREDKQAEIMSDVVEYVEQNYKNTPSLSELAERLGYEYCYFSKIFNRMFSMSFNEYLNTYRFNEACAMLTITDMPITDVAYESGFKSIRSFNNTFKKLAGISPSEYRRAQPSAHSFPVTVAGNSLCAE